MEATAGAPSGFAMHRLIAALKRYKWLALGVILLGTGAGVAALRFLTPEYEVQATIWIQSEAPNDKNSIGPIRSQELLSSGAWVELLKSYRISDAVVRKLALYVVPENHADKWLFRGFSLADRFAPGQYELVVSPTGRSWLLRTQMGAAADSGTSTDSIGRRLGFQWQIPPQALRRRANSSVKFTIETPRETSTKLMDRLGTQLGKDMNFLRLTYADPDRDLAARTLNTWANEYVTVAGDLKKRNMVEFTSILEGQLDFAQTALTDAERSLEDFRVHTITLPAEGGPVAAGVEVTRDPALTSFFDQKIAYDNLRHDREAVEKVIANASAGQAPYEGLLLIPSVAQSPGAEALRDAFKKEYELRADLAAKRTQFTDAYLKDEITQLTTVEKQTIPSLSQQLLLQLREREGDYQRRISGAAKDIQQIPTRTIEEMRLRRAVTVAEGLYTTLKSRYAEAKLAEAGASPDVSVLDSAVAPLKPSKNTAPSIIAIAILASIGAAIGLAMLLDRVDGRFRYPEQAANELGLGIAGVVPRLPKKGLDTRRADQVFQLVESFRTLRMYVIHTLPGRPVSLAISSAEPGDGKSLVSGNLAMSFAEAGFRTVLIDGDTRRGALHEMFGVNPENGLTEYLFGRAGVDDILVPTGHDNLTVVACGRRHHRTPEFLTSPRFTDLIASLKSRYDVVLFDTPPLAAGIDGYAISAATGSLLMVLRVGESERRVIAAKLAVTDRLPITVIGVVLNGVQLTGEFQYYGYAASYASNEYSTELLTAATE